MVRRWWLALMLLLVVACAADQPVSSEPTLDPLAARGNTLFQLHCATCHATVAETVIVGPSLAGIVSRASTRAADLSPEEYVQLSILKPDLFVVNGFTDVMPKDFGKKLTGEDLDALVAYLMTLD